MKLGLGRRTFRCDHYYEDGSCYGGPDGGGCRKRKKREEGRGGIQLRIEQGQNSSRIRSTTDKEFANSVDLMAWADEKIDKIGRTTEAVKVAKRSKRQSGLQKL